MCNNNNDDGDVAVVVVAAAAALVNNTRLDNGLVFALLCMVYSHKHQQTEVNIATLSYLPSSALTGVSSVDTTSA